LTLPAHRLPITQGIHQPLPPTAVERVDALGECDKRTRHVETAGGMTGGTMTANKRWPEAVLIATVVLVLAGCGGGEVSSSCRRR